MQSVYSRLTAMWSGCTPVESLPWVTQVSQNPAVRLKQSRSRAPADTSNVRHATGLRSPSYSRKSRVQNSFAQCAHTQRAGKLKCTETVRCIDVSAGVEQKLHKLNIASSERVVKRSATASMLPVVGICTTLEQPARNMQPRERVGRRISIPSCNLVQSTVKITLGHTCEVNDLN